MHLFGRRQQPDDASPATPNAAVAALAARLPDPLTLAGWLRAMAVADAILCPEWSDRCYLFDQAWAVDEHLAQFRTGSGDSFSVTFTPAGAYLRAFDHESSLSPWNRRRPAVHPGLLDGLPERLRPCADEPAFTADDVVEVTLALWWLAGADRWSHGHGDPNDDGGVALLDTVDGTAESYLQYAQDYFDEHPDPGAVRSLFDGEPLTSSIVRAISPDRELDELTDDLSTIGYPRA